MKAYLLNRRTLVSLLTATALAFSVQQAWAAQPVVEIIAYKHPPVQSALKNLRAWLAAQGNKILVKEIDLESAEGEKRLNTLGIKGHMPIVILIDGKYKFTRKDGSFVEFVSFPAGDNPHSASKEGWTVEDAKSMILTAVK